MPGGFPGNFSICNAQSVAALSATSKGTAITASGSTNTKGSYTSLITSTPYRSSYLSLQITQLTSALYLVDIAIGTSGNQVVIIPNIFLGSAVSSGSARTSMAVALPMAIPAGTNIWARSQSATTAAVCQINLQLYSGSFNMYPGAAGYDDLGTTLASSFGTLITPSATANTMGTWTSLVTATARPYMGLWGTIGLGTASDFYFLNIGIGGSGTQQIIVPNWATSNLNQVGILSGTCLPFIPFQIPAGTQIWAQNQCSAASAGGQNILLYGAYQ